jgi:hypothetical protein
LGPNETCHDRRDASDDTGLYTCLDGSHEEDWRDCEGSEAEDEGEEETDDGGCQPEDDYCDEDEVCTEDDVDCVNDLAVEEGYEYDG